MKSWLVAVALLWPVAAASVSSPTMEVSFATPAQVAGNLQAEASWALLLFGESRSTFQFLADAGAQQTNYTFYFAHQTGPRGHGTWAAPIPAESRTIPNAVDGVMDFRGETWASLEIEADSIELSNVAINSAISQVKPGDDLRSRLPLTTYAGESFWGGVGPPPTWLIASSAGPTINALPLAGSQLPFTLQAKGLHRLVWHNATNTCMATCPDSGRPFQLGTANPTGGSEAQRLSYIQLDVSGGTLAGGGSALAWVAGGPAIRAAVAGHLRLPDAELQGACPSGPCPNPNGRTFQADGNLTLSDLALNNDHVRGGLSGQFTSAFFDESPAPGFGGVAAAAAAAVVAVGIGFGLRYLWTAFARSARPPVLEDASRKKIHDTIREHPGFSFSELRRHLGWSTGRLEYHLGFLVEAGLVVRHRDGKAVRFFENHGKYDDTWRHVAPLREDDARRLHDWLLKTPGLDQTRIAETTAAWGWTRARTLRRLARLEEGGLLSAKRDGKRLRYTAIRAPV